MKKWYEKIISMESFTSQYQQKEKKGTKMGLNIIYFNCKDA